jgi:hypothetical protein
MTGGSAHLDDIVLAILSQLPRTTKMFSANREKLHRAFYQMKEAHKDQLSDLAFRDRGFFPESPGLDQALANLEASGLLHRMNESPLFYEIDSEIKESYSSFAKKRLDARGFTATQAEEMADALLHELGTGGGV